MKKLGRYIWLIFVVAIIVLVVAFNLEEVRSFLNKLLDSFVKLSLLGKILIGFAIWLALVIIPLFVYAYLVEQPEEGPGIFWLFFYTIIWPPAWPIAIVLWILIRHG